MSNFVYEKHGHVRLIMINRPDKMNSLDLDANDEMVEIWNEFDEDDEFDEDSFEEDDFDDGFEDVDGKY